MGPSGSDMNTYIYQLVGSAKEDGRRSGRPSGCDWSKRYSSKGEEPVSVKGGSA